MEDIMKICIVRHPKSIHARRWIEYFAKRGHEIHVLYFEGDGSDGPEVDKYYPDIARLENVYIHCIKDNFSELKIIKLVRNMPIVKTIKQSDTPTQTRKKSGNYIKKLIRYSLAGVAGLISTFIKARNLRKMVKKINPDIMHALSVNYYGCFAALSGFHPFVVTPYGSDISWYPEQSKMAKRKIKFVLKNADIVHVGDEPAKSRVIELGCRQDKIFIQPIGVNTKEFLPTKKSLELKELLGLANSPVVISILHLVYFYDEVESLIFSMPKILEKFPEAKFIIGGGDGEQKDELMRLAEQLKVSKAVRFVGYIPHEKLPTYLASSDIYVDTYYYKYPKAGGGIGVGLMEAMSCGLAPVVSRKPFDFVIRDGVNGLHFQGGNAGELAEKIISLLENEDKRKEFGRKNRDIALKIGDWNKNNEIFEREVYLKLNKKRKNKRCCKNENTT